MAGIKYVCVSEGKAYEIPLSKIKDGKVFDSRLSDQTVLRMELVYVTQNRNPYEIVRILFDRIAFDKAGIYDIGAAVLSDEFRVEFDYATRESTKLISEITGTTPHPLPIPKAPIIPTNEDIAIIKAYLNKKYPLLLKNSPSALEESIQIAKEHHKEKIKQMKKSYLN